MKRIVFPAAVFLTLTVACGVADTPVLDVIDPVDEGYLVDVSSRDINIGDQGGDDVRVDVQPVDIFPDADDIQNVDVVSDIAIDTGADTVDATVDVLPADLLEDTAVVCQNDEECDDQNICTTDKCEDDGSCSHACVCEVLCEKDEECSGATCQVGVCVVTSGEGSCIASRCELRDLDCDDGDDCTNDSCSMTTGACVHDRDPECGGCVADADCVSDDQCLTGACDMDSGECVFLPIDGADGDPCTVDTCIPGTGCHHDYACPCSVDNDCDDGNECTAEICDDASRCVYSLISCDDGLGCTVDSCDPETGCVHTASGDLCQSPSDCDDGDECTNDQTFQSPGTDSQDKGGTSKV